MFDSNQLMKVMLLSLACLDGSVWGFDKRTEYRQRSQRLSDADVTERMRLAEWCEKNQLKHEAAVEYRKVINQDSNQVRAYERLCAIREDQRLPESRSRQQELLNEFPDDFRLHVAPHFLVIYNTDEAWARSRAAMLEIAHETFYSVFRRAGSRPLPLETRLVCVLFKGYRDFTDYAFKHEGLAVDWAGGFYSGRSNRVIFFDERTSPNFQRLVSTIQELEEDLQTLEAARRRATAKLNYAAARDIKQAYARVLKRLRWYKNKHASISKKGNTSKTIHEAVHQIAFNCGMMDRRVRYPFWLAEGLAASFEVEDPSQRFGPRYDNGYRRRMLKESEAEGRLLDIEKLIHFSFPPPGGPDQIRILYAQSWAFYSFLFRYRNDALRDYLQRLSTGHGDDVSEEETRESFIRSFGPIDKLNSLWQRYLKRLPSS